MKTIGKGEWRVGGQWRPLGRVQRRPLRREGAVETTGEGAVEAIGEGVQTTGEGTPAHYRDPGK